MKQFVNVLNQHSRRQVGDKGGEDRGMECEAESKPHGTDSLFRHIPSGVVKSFGKKWFQHKNLIVKEPSFLRGAQSTDFFGPQFRTVNK